MLYTLKENPTTVQRKRIHSRTMTMIRMAHKFHMDHANVLEGIQKLDELITKHQPFIKRERVPL
ncbi:hypothetical protein [Oceanobacillus halotolerans]|uniref:hypothetical protein n=1 Tax=Oceanobacillus halotolerans TaxID=2663380 RepID=UPI0013DAF9D8|nr:hypothetical protein [Oceanobacillus halotolerans]